MAEEQTPVRQIKMVYLEPGGLMMVGVVAGFLCGFVMVALDPWLRFPDAPLRPNWREALLTASMLGAYAAVLGWILTTFWRTWMLWLITVMLTPLVTGAIAAWNNINAAFGIKSDFLIFLPMTLIFNLMTMGLVVIYLNMVLRSPLRRKLAYAAIPIAIILLTFLGLGRLRWSNQDARDIVMAVNTYAGGLNTDDYSIEFLGIRYDGDTAPTGNALLYTDAETLVCRVRLFPQTTDIDCVPQE